MAGTQSVLADDQRLLGIPRSRQTVAIIYPQYDPGLQGFPATSGQGPTSGRSLLHRINVVRVRPRTSGSITDLLLALACVHFGGRTQHLREAEHRRRLSGGPRGRSPQGTRAGDERTRGPPGEAARDRDPTRYEPGATGRQISHSLSESTRQITPPIRSGHAPPSTGSRKSSQSVHPDCVLTW